MMNVLRGDMSLVGPRPKLPEHQVADFPWRPGITGAATYAFAREEEFLATVPAHQLDFYYHRRILPAKHKLDTDYMRRASFRSDVRLLVDTLLRRWGKSIVRDILDSFEEETPRDLIKEQAQLNAESHVLFFETASSGD